MFDGQNQHLAAQHLRTLLVPESKIFGNILILIDARFDLHGAENDLLLGKQQNHFLAQMFSIAAGHHQANQVVAVARCKGSQEQKFGFGFTRQRSHHIGGRQRPRRAALFVGELRGVPGVGLVVERVGVAHMEQPVDIGLHAENQFRIADVTTQIGGHGR